MDTTNTIRDFAKALFNSPLPDQRKDYWSQRLSDPQMQEQEMAVLSSELEGNAAELDTAMAIYETENETDQMHLDALTAAAIPAFRSYSAAIDEQLTQDDLAYKQAVSNLEGEMMTQVSSIRSEADQDQMAAIRKKLGI
jgi:hypothetical protein